MTYSQCLDYLFGQLPMYQRIGAAAYKADLDATWALMSHLGEPHKKFKSIHVAGTNGKGSVSHLLASCLQEAGYRTGLYTSPHLLDFRERVLINGEMISEKAVVQFVQENQSHFEKLQLSFFEWTVGLAFQYFAEQEIDIAVIEVGMGGRLDSTNVVLPELSIITNIGLDHTQFLGDTIEKIAAEKAGIIKPKVPVVIGKRQAESAPVFIEKASAMQAPVSFSEDLQMSDLPTPLIGKHQKENSGTVQTAIKILADQGWEIPQQALEDGFRNVLSNTRLRGRWQILQKEPLSVCDVAHNVDGIEAVMSQIEATNFSRLHLVLGFVSDKSIEKMIGLFPSNARYYLTQSSIPRALPLAALTTIALDLNLDFSAHSSVSDAYITALQQASPEDLIFVGGSTFVVADLLAFTNKKRPADQSGSSLK